ncbi:hypothetical protein DASC09_041070 [Saccharomycopsis crataegensis]|uniref:6-phosphofructo-2-kinase domain-containing protein n=1 Tax=Saccharomycopsis crataegensis TaxID=43959 RepID=A0AAV5QQ88_9ASCO|nr:hypothetical protein DASC09_041070 [Saccharomycopsis crataegensis]
MSAGIRKTFSEFFNESPLISRTNSVEFDTDYYPQRFPVKGLSYSSLNDSLLIILVGLPACGKSTIAKYLIKHLQAHNYPYSKIYNAGNVRRNHLSPIASLDNRNPPNPTPTSSFFKKDGEQLRDEFAFIAFEKCLSDLFNHQINVAVFDATNSTAQRRSRLNFIINLYLRKINSLVSSSPCNLKVLLLDIKCTNPKYWKFNMELKVSFSPDYTNSSSSNFANHNAKLKDFVQRTEYYIENYEPVTSTELDQYGWDYITIDNCGEYVNHRSYDVKNHYKLNAAEASGKYNNSHKNDMVSEKLVSRLELEQKLLSINSSVRDEKDIPKQLPCSSDEKDDSEKENDDTLSFSAPEISKNGLVMTPSSSLSSTSTYMEPNNNNNNGPNQAMKTVYEFTENYLKSQGTSYIAKAKNFCSDKTQIILTNGISAGAYGDQSNEAIGVEEMDEKIFSIIFSNPNHKKKIFQSVC